MAFAIIKHDQYETGMTHDKREIFLVDGEFDIANLPQDSAPGSVAYIADGTQAWQMSPSKIWVQISNPSVFLKRFVF